MNVARSAIRLVVLCRREGERLCNGKDLWQLQYLLVPLGVFVVVAAFCFSAAIYTRIVMLLCCYIVVLLLQRSSGKFK